MYVLEGGQGQISSAFNRNWLLLELLWLRVMLANKYLKNITSRNDHLDCYISQPPTITNAYMLQFLLKVLYKHGLVLVFQHLNLIPTAVQTSAQHRLKFSDWSMYHTCFSIIRTKHLSENPSLIITLYEQKCPMGFQLLRGRGGIVFHVTRARYTVYNFIVLPVV